MSVAVATPPSAMDALTSPPQDRSATEEAGGAIGRRGGWYALAVVGVVLASVWAWDTYKYEFFAKRFGVVEQGGLYRSGQISATMFAPTILDNEIDTVVCLTGEDPQNPDYLAEVAAVAEMPGVKFQQFPLRGDGTGDFEVYFEALAALASARRADRTVLVHCAAGSQRTGSLVAAYQLLVLRMDCSDVYAHLCRYDWEPEDAAMLNYLNKHLPECARRLYERGLINEIPDPMPVLGP